MAAPTISESWSTTACASSGTMPEYPWCARRRSADIRRQFARGRLREADACCTNHSSVWCVVADRANISTACERSGSDVADRSTVTRSSFAASVASCRSCSSGSAPLSSIRRTSATVLAAAVACSCARLPATKR